MSHYFFKIFKIGLLVVVSTLFISGTKLEGQLSPAILIEDDYTLRISGNINNNLSGMVNFETAIQTTSKGISFSTLKLKLNDDEGLLPHSIEFLISKENTKDVLPVGTYNISRDQEGFLNYFDGVFGFANINALGESPLFAKSGEIQIDYLDDNTVKGTLGIAMGNTEGRYIQIQGHFRATR